MPDTTSGLWNAGDVYRRIALGTWVSATPEFSVSFSPAPAATPFTTGSYEGYIITASTTMTVTGTKNVEYLVVAGGGGGGKGPYSTGPTYDGGLHNWAGGGAGGYRSSVPGESSGGGASAEPTLALSTGPYTVTVGGGGNFNTNGSSSSIASPTITPISTVGGGYGGRSANPSYSSYVYGVSPSTIGDGQPGGSGGGAALKTVGSGPPGGLSDGTIGNGTANQGYSGGPSNAGSEVSPWNNHMAGGGGGAGGAGAAGGGPSATAGKGGVGVASSITGSPVYRAGGGGGGSYSYHGAGGNGGGGTSYVTAPNIPLSNATANTGGGGGGGYYSVAPDATSGAKGGSGVVIIRWLA